MPKHAKAPHMCIHASAHMFSQHLWAWLHTFIHMLTCMAVCTQVHTHTPCLLACHLHLFSLLWPHHSTAPQGALSAPGLRLQAAVRIHPLSFIPLEPPAVGISGPGCSLFPSWATWRDWGPL